MNKQNQMKLKPGVGVFYAILPGNKFMLENTGQKTNSKYRQYRN